MALFLTNITSFPTVIYTILMVVVILYWAIAAMGLVNIDLFSPGHTDVGAGVDLGGDIGGDVGGGEHVDLSGHHSDIHGHQTELAKAEGLEGLAAILMKLGLTGVPITIIISFIVFWAWILCYFTMLFVLQMVPTDLLKGLAGIVALIGAFLLALPLAAKSIVPLKVLFEKANTQISSKSFVGQFAFVRTSKVTEKFGEANYDDSGAGIIMKIRAKQPNTIKRGDRVVLLEYKAAEHAYLVMPDNELYS